MNVSMESDPRAQEIVRLVIQVQGKLLTATEAAAKLGMSRKTYYKWENRLLGVMLEAARLKDAGRPASEKDPEKEALREEIDSLKRELLLLEQKLHIREVLSAVSDDTLNRGKKG